MSSTSGYINSEVSTFEALGLTWVIKLRVDWNIEYVGADGTLNYKVYYISSQDEIIGNLNGELLFEFDDGVSSPVQLTSALTGSTSGGTIQIDSGSMPISSGATKLYLRDSSISYSGVHKLDKTVNISGTVNFNECYLNLATNYNNIGVNNTYGGTYGSAGGYTHTNNPYNSSVNETNFINNLEFKWTAKLNENTMQYDVSTSTSYTDVDGFDYGTIDVKLILLDTNGNEVYLDSNLTQEGILSANSSSVSIPFNGYLSNGTADQIVGFRMEMSLIKTVEYYKTVSFFRFKEKDFLANFKASSATIGATQELLYDCSSIAKEYDIKYQFGNLTGYAIQNASIIQSTRVWETVTWTVPVEFYNEMPDSKVKNCSYQIILKKNGVILGSISTTADIYINESVCAPVINPTIIDTNTASIGVTHNSSTLVRYVSNAKVNTGITLFRGATVKSVVVINGNQKMEQETGTFTKVTDKNFHITVTDSRGVTSNKTVTVPFVEYIMPTCDIKASKPNVDGEIKINITGYCYNGSFGGVGEENNFRVSYRYKPTGGEYTDYTNTYASLSGNSYSVDLTLTGLDYKKTYVIEAVVVDSLFTVDAVPVSSKGEPIFDWDNSSMNINVPLTITQSIHVPNSGFYVEDTAIDFSSLVSVETGTWTPSMVNAVTYSSQGNYIKIGNLCIINWNIQARGESSGGQIKVYGLPFSLNGATFQSGGGTISGVSIPSGHSFSGWELSSDGNIYARTMVSGSSGDAGYATMVESQTYNLYASGTLMYVVS